MPLFLTFISYTNYHTFFHPSSFAEARLLFIFIASPLSKRSLIRVRRSSVCTVRRLAVSQARVRFSARHGTPGGEIFSRNPIMETEQVQVYVEKQTFLCVCALYRKSNLCIPRIVRSLSQLLHSYVCERFIPGSVHLFGCNIIDRPILEYINLSQIYECRNWGTGRSL
jgi:hypothetical protein